MVLEIVNSNLIARGLNNNVKKDRLGGKIYFNGTTAPDTFSNNSPSKLFSETEIKKMISNNPEISKILKENKIPLKLNMTELELLMANHCKDVIDNSCAIAANLPPSLKQKVNLKDLKEAAMLHDFGKVLIPEAVLNKNSSLDTDERKIMDLHSELGYQLLKTTGVSDNVLNLIRYHHCNQSAMKNFIPDINLQILNLADKYSALTEPRVYKKEYTPKQALTILHKEVEEGKVHPFLYNALVNSLQKSANMENVTTS